MPPFHVRPEVFGFKFFQFLVSFVGLLQVEVPQRFAGIHPAKIQGVIHNAVYLITPALGAGEVFDLFYFADKGVVSDQW